VSDDFNALIRSQPILSQAAGAVLTREQIRAHNKIEIHFGPKRSALNSYVAMIHLWESGKHMHGGGDDLMYWCVNRVRLATMKPDSTWKFYLDLLKRAASERQMDGCGHHIKSSYIGRGAATCPNCRMLINQDNLTEYLPFYGTTNELAGLVAVLFNMLEADADVYCKYDRDDIRYSSMEKASGVETAHRLRGMFIYPLKNILKETSGGATIEARFRAFFNA
jgi:hypothetical protein